MHLDELTIAVKAALLIKSGLGRPGANHGIRRLAKYRSIAAGGDDDGIRGKSANFHAAQIHGADAAADAVPVEHGREKFPVLVFFYLAFGFVAPHLLVERV